jgi:hypothetical protein
MENVSRVEESRFIFIGRSIHKIKKEHAGSYLRGEGTSSGQIERISLLV